MCYHIAEGKECARIWTAASSRLCDKVAGINIQLANISDFTWTNFHALSISLLLSRLLSARHHKSLKRGWRKFSRDSYAIYTTIKAKQNVEGTRRRRRRRRKSLSIFFGAFIILAVELLCKWGMTADRSIKFISFFPFSPFSTAFPSFPDVRVYVGRTVKCDYASRKCITTQRKQIEYKIAESFNVSCKFY